MKFLDQNQLKILQHYSTRYFHLNFFFNAYIKFKDKIYILIIFRTNH